MAPLTTSSSRLRLFSDSAGPEAWSACAVDLAGMDGLHPCASVASCASIANSLVAVTLSASNLESLPVRIEEHRTTVVVGISPRTGADVTSHTWRTLSLPAPPHEGVDSPLSSSQRTPGPARRSSNHRLSRSESLRRIRVASFNTWNSNPPRWLWREPHDRMRQYALRMAHAGDVLRQAAADVIALQEVRFDSTLGGRDHGGDDRDGGGLQHGNAAAAGAATKVGGADENERGKAVGRSDERRDDDGIDERSLPANVGPLEARASYALSLALAETWYNRTRAIAEHPAYAARNARKWQAVTGSLHFAALAAQHPYEGVPAAAPLSSPAAADASAHSDTALSASAPAPASSPSLPSPYARGMPRAEGVRLSSVRRALRTHPHAQVEHIAAHLPGYQYVSTPAQLYLDPARWLHEGEPHRDEEGPAIFSRWPILRHNYMLLSKDVSDDGDGHQRAVLHAVIEVPSGCSGERAAPVAGAGDADAAAAESVEQSAAAAASAAQGNCDPFNPHAAHRESPLLLDVYTVHLSLSEAARNRTVREITAFVRATAEGALQVLAGDMNAEPHEAAMRWLARGGGGSGAGSGGLAAAAAALPRVCKFSEHGWRPCMPADVDAATQPADASAAAAAADITKVSLSADGSLAAAAASGDGVASDAAAQSTQVAHANSSAAESAWPVFADTFTLTLGGSVPEPPPRSPDPAFRRYAFTFPSDDPVKRIDLVLVAAHPEHAVMSSDGGSDGGSGAAPAAARAAAVEANPQAAGKATEPAAAAVAASRLRVSVARHFLLGQDPLPGTDTMEGLGAGMLSQRSPIYASDHRAVVVDLTIEGGGGGTALAASAAAEAAA